MAASSGSGFIRRIVKLEATTGGGYRPVEIYARKTRKISKQSKPLERALRRMAKAQRKFAEIYLERHERSGAKKKNGALKDLWKNLYTAARKGSKGL